MPTINLAAKIFAVFLLLPSICAADSAFYFPAAKLQGLPVPKAEPEAVPAADDTQPVNKEWTVMVFLNGNSPDFSGVTEDPDEMEAIGTTANVNMVLQIAANKGFATRHLIIKDSSKGLASPALMTLPAADMGDYHAVVDFVNWAKANYPAKKYALIISAHGFGYIDKYAKPQPKMISKDSVTGNYISTPELGEIVRQIGWLDLIGFDACLMQMAEVIYEIKDNVGVVVGSVESVLAFGFDYTGFLSALDADPGMPAEDAGKALAKTYVQYARKMNPACAQASVVQTKALTNLASALDNWVKLVMSDKYEHNLSNARDFAMRFGVDGFDSKYLTPYADLQRFVETYVLEIICQDITPELKATTKQVTTALEQAVIANYAFGTTPAKSSLMNFGGLSIHVPVIRRGVDFSGDNMPGSKYSELAWSNDTLWDEFLKWAYRKSDNRPPFFPEKP